MSKSLIYDFQSSEMTDEAKTISLPRISADNLAMTDSIVDEISYTNISSPVDRPETVTFGSQVVKNVYNNTGISTSVQMPSTVGSKILLRYHATLSEVDSEDANYRRDIPFGMTITITSGNSESFSDELYYNMTRRAIAHLFTSVPVGTGTDMTSLLGRLRRGALEYQKERIGTEGQ